MTRRALTALFLCAAALLAVSACSDLDSDESSRDESGEVTEGGDVGALALQVGDCVADSTIGSVEEVPVVPCDEPHRSQVIHTFDLDDGDFPGDPAMQAEAETQCTGQAFEDYVGVGFQQSELTVSFITPSQQTWDELDDREVLCLAERVDGAQLTQSVEGSGI